MVSWSREVGVRGTGSREKYLIIREMKLSGRRRQFHTDMLFVADILRSVLLVKVWDRWDTEKYNMLS
jgi:hypothetical protein